MRIYFKITPGHDMVDERFSKLIEVLVVEAKNKLAPLKERIESYPEHSIIIEATLTNPGFRILNIPSKSLQLEIMKVIV